MTDRTVRYRVELKSVVGSTAVLTDLTPAETHFLRGLAAQLLAAAPRPGMPTLILREER